MKNAYFAKKKSRKEAADKIRDYYEMGMISLHERNRLITEIHAVAQ